MLCHSNGACYLDLPDTLIVVFMRQFSEPFQPLTAAARQQSLEDALAARPAAARQLVIFGYASLMWAPDIPHDRIELAALNDWRRALVVWTTLARGSLKNPGLALGLTQGGACEGAALFVPQKHEAQALDILWAREIWTDIYEPAWVPVTMGTEVYQALTFVTNRQSRQYSGDMALAEKAAYVAAAKGNFGSCRDYLTDTVAYLRRFNIVEPELETIVAHLPEAADGPSLTADNT